jgi:hypothetical protein
MTVAAPRRAAWATEGCGLWRHRHTLTCRWAGPGGQAVDQRTDEAVFLDRLREHAHKAPLAEQQISEQSASSSLLLLNCGEQRIELAFRKPRWHHCIGAGWRPVLQSGYAVPPDGSGRGIKRMTADAGEGGTLRKRGCQRVMRRVRSGLRGRGIVVDMDAP